jgi:hypothetical protein
MTRRKPSTEVVLLLAGAFTGPGGVAALIAAVAVLASLPALASPQVRAPTGSHGGFAAGGRVLTSVGDVGPPLPAPVAAFEELVEKRENLEGKPTAADVRRARRANRKTNRLLTANPYFRLYKIGKRRFRVSCYLLASVHYEKRHAAAHPRAVTAGIGSGLFRKGLGAARAWSAHRNAFRGIRRPRRYPHRTRFHPSAGDDFDVIMAAAAGLRAAGARGLGSQSGQAL